MSATKEGHARVGEDEGKWEELHAEFESLAKFAKELHRKTREQVAVGSCLGVRDHGAQATGGYVARHEGTECAFSGCRIVAASDHP